ncbi:MAG: hypothetical protein R3A79_03665 [Nannocystaceae bacterium]
MPTTNDNRATKITAKTASVTASDFDVDFTATFTTDQSASLKFTDASSGSDDDTLHEVIISDPASGSELARTSVSVAIASTLAGNFSATLARDSRSALNPASSGAASEVRRPQATSRRDWSQAVLENGSDAVLNAADVDIKSAGDGLTAAHSVRVNSDSTYEVAVTFSDRSGATIASGTITLTTSLSAGAGFTLGAVDISEPGGGGRRLGARSRRG